MKMKTLCQLAQEKSIEELKKLAINAKYICPGCFRVSSDPKRICCNAQLIDSDTYGLDDHSQLNKKD